jgi:hypothetical protein
VTSERLAQDTHGFSIRLVWGTGSFSQHAIKPTTTADHRGACSVGDGTTPKCESAMTVVGVVFKVWTCVNPLVP